MTASARNVLDSLEIIDTRETGRDSYEVCAAGRATFDETAAQLCIQLDAFVRRFEMRGKDQEFRPAWLPNPETVRMRVSHEEASEAAKDIFNSWARKVRRTIPASNQWMAKPDR